MTNSTDVSDVKMTRFVIKILMFVQVDFPVLPEHNNMVFGLFPFVSKIQAY